MQPTLVEKPPDGGNWIHEVKWDGYRTQLVIQSGSARLFTRRGYDWTKRYARGCRRGAQAALQHRHHRRRDHPRRPGRRIGLRRASVGHRQPSRPADLRRLRSPASSTTKICGSRALIERRELLGNLIGRGGTRIQFSQQLPGMGAQVFKVVEDAGLEGIVSKRTNSPYRSGRTREWLKIKAFEEAEFELLGASANGTSHRSPCWPATAGTSAMPSHAADREPRTLLAAGRGERRTAAKINQAEGCGKGRPVGSAGHDRPRRLPEGRGVATACNAQRLARARRLELSEAGRLEQIVLASILF